MIKQSIFKPMMFGRYCLIDQISKGGMSDIYLAKTVGVGGFQKPLVIKKLLPQYSTKSRYVKRFINEANMLARLNHANIVQILDMGMIAGEYYIALEYIEGRNVAHITLKSRTQPDTAPSGIYCVRDFSGNSQRGLATPIGNRERTARI